jgi:hypothetical protein
LTLASLILAVVHAGVCLRLGASYWLLSAHGATSSLARCWPPWTSSRSDGGQRLVGPAADQLAFMLREDGHQTHGQAVGLWHVDAHEPDTGLLER